jgi:arylformamidase
MAGGPPAEAAAPTGDTRKLNDVTYGPDPAQRLDVYIPGGAKKAPVIVMMHGGAWVLGSKGSRGVYEAKVSHWLPRGYIFVSVETRLLPAADPLEQAGDLAAALSYVQQHAMTWGGDPSRLVLMGHSAGAHLVALLTADPTIAGKSKLRPWTASIALDSAAYDVGKIMNARHARLYDRAFGSDSAFWRRASPTLQVKGKPAPALLVCSSKRSDSCNQAAAFSTALKRAGGRADILPEDLNHMQINGELGKEGGYTSAVDNFLKSLGLP